MERKNFLTKNIFYIFFALCFFAVGVMTIAKSQSDEITFAEDVSESVIDNQNIPDYFLVQEFLDDNAGEDGEDSSNSESLITYDTFRYFSEESTANYLQLSLATNGESWSTNPIYSHVYYPDLNNRSNFYFYSVENVTLYINGERQNTTDKTFINDTGLSFPNYMGSSTGNALTLDDFSMVFDNSGSATNAISILDENGNVVEGVYRVSIHLMLCGATDGTNDASEDSFLQEEEVTIDYSFFVLDNSNYFDNNRPIVNNFSFDHQVLISDVNNANAFRLYSNYTSKSGVGTSTTTNQIPYIEFDYTRFEADISKNFSNTVQTANIAFDKDFLLEENPSTSPVVVTGDEIVYVDFNAETQQCRIYFTDLGEYSISLNPIKLVQTSAGIQKYALEGMASVTRNVAVYLYGYQIGYTNFDEAPDENNVRPFGEMKTHNFTDEDGTKVDGFFSDSADITSAFVNSNPSYSQDALSTTFLRTNIVSFLNNQINSGYEIVKTNQTPIRLNTNASYNSGALYNSYILSTNQMNNSSTTSLTLQNSPLYVKDFTGSVESADGIYIYVIAYTYNNYFESENYQNSEKVFYQVFCFEITKGTPNISVTSEDGNEVFSGSFVNQSVVIDDTTKENPYNQDVTVQIYAVDYTNNNSYLTGFGGEYGISLSQLNENEGRTGNSVTLSANAHYTIRLYYTNQLSSIDTRLSSTGYISQQTFTIDTIQITGITGRNVSEITSSSDYTILDNMTSFATNQSMVLSWDEKLSGATTEVYYRYFPLATSQYYSPSDESNVSEILDSMLRQSSATLPVNAVLNLSATNNNWLPLNATSVDPLNVGNTENLQLGDRVSSNYVLSRAGLYIINIIDSAGNQAYDVFFIDDTSPIFALFDETSLSYSIPSTTVYITDTSTLYWGDYKGIYIQNFNSDLYTNYTLTQPPTITSSTSLSNFYQNRDGDIEMEIWQTMYEKLYNPSNETKNMQYFTIRDVNVGSGVSATTTYTGMYMTIAINDISYYTDLASEQTNFTQQQGNQHEIGVEEENTYTVLIRDLSNTKRDLNSSSLTANDYANYYSARQTVIVSFDQSRFSITYQNSSGQTESLTPVFTEEGMDDEDETLRTLTSYLNPTRMETSLSISFIPTSMADDGTTQIQVESVEIRYYAYVLNEERASDGIYYYDLSETPEITYAYTFDGMTSSNETTTIPIGTSNTQRITNDGKYEIVRTYMTGDGYSINTRDYYQRTYVLYVDRNEVVSNPETIGNDGHSESLVGGDIFVAMFDNGTSSNLVVTFPNSEEGNTDGQSIYNNGSNIQINPTTNKIPVNVYVPMYKYTTYVQKNQTTNGYDFTVNYDFETQEVVDETQGTTTETYDDMNNYNSENVINEYVLYAEIYKDGSNPNNLIATTSNDINSIASRNGFLVFYGTNGQELPAITEAGTYYVRIYQGRFGTGLDDNRFENYKEFRFEILQATPEFNIQQTNGSSIYSEPVSNASYTTAYYTNQANVTLSWEAATDKYMIEVDEITLSTRSRTYSIVKNTDAEGNVSWTTDNEEIWTSLPHIEGSMWNATLNLRMLSGVYENNGYVDITMQFRTAGSLYSPVTKRLNVDLSAPVTNINNLVSLSSSGIITSMNESSLRSHLTADLQTTTDVNNTSFNISNRNDNNTFAYYSYTVSSSYLQTLVSSKDYMTYIRLFNDKYSGSSIRETYPSEFMARNFDEVSTVSALQANSYYEVVETDKAGNMTIYTIYVTDHSSDCDIISYVDGNMGEQTSYDTADYSLVQERSGAIHNIYSRTGFSLTGINFFGDEWAQITLTTYSARGDRTVRTLMLSPYDPGYAIAFVGNTTQRIAISDLIDGSTGSTYKHSIAIYNRQTGLTETFYVNIYNTSLSASLTEDQNAEYIRFAYVSDAQIQNTTTASTYVTQIRISANGSVIYEQSNPLGYASIWRSNANVNVVTQNNAYLTFELNPDTNFSSNARILYEYTDNYGRQYQEIHIYRETIISQEITSSGSLYSFYDTDTGILYYISDTDFQFTYNPNKYSVQPYYIIEGEKGEQIDSADFSDVQNSNLAGTRILTVPPRVDEDGRFNQTYVLEIRDSQDNTNIIREVYFILYNELPVHNKTTGSNSPGQFKIYNSNRLDITDEILSNESTETGYYSEIQIVFTLNESNFIPVKYSISSDGVTWRELTSGERLTSQSGELETYYLKIWYDEEYLLNAGGTPEYVFGDVPRSQIYTFNLSSLTTTYWVELSRNGQTTIIDKSGQTYYSASGMQYVNHYLVNIPYSDHEQIEIRCNQEQDIQPVLYATLDDGAGVYTEIWTISNTGTTTGSPEFNTRIAITYIPPSNNFVEEFYVSNLNGVIDNQNMINSSSYTLAVPEAYTSVDRMELRWSKYYGLVQNEIQIEIVKDGMAFEPVIYSTTDYFYTYLTYSGKYLIRLYDLSGNVQRFNIGSTGQTEQFTLIFLKDVPFTVTYTNPETGESETTLPIKQAVYNGSVTLNIDSSTRSEFYMLSGYPTISVLKNGEAYDGGFRENETAFTFEEAGYYEITFTATSNQTDVGVLRQETYQFTILNAQEYKISYVYNQYSNYYVERVLKDGQDITQDLIRTLDTPTINVGGTTYLAQLPLSYLDEKTGVGTYLITVNSNNQMLQSSSETNAITSFTFQVIINQGTAPIRISISEGASTTSEISVTYNLANIFAEMGECTIRVVSYSDQGVMANLITPIQVTSESTGEGNIPIATRGTYYVQIVSPSGNLLFSYKVIKNDPMNAATIIIIVVAVVVVLIVLLLIFKLRKRISVK